MIKFICGSKGSGKTKFLIDMANSDIKAGNGNIAFIDVDDKHILTLDYSVRLINAMEFNIRSIESFYGFLCGIIGGDYDIEKIYVDGIYNLVEIKSEDLESLAKKLEMMSQKFNTDFFIGLDYTLDKLPESLREYSEEIKDK